MTFLLIFFYFYGVFMNAIGISFEEDRFPTLYETAFWPIKAGADLIQHVRHRNTV